MKTHLDKITVVLEELLNIHSTMTRHHVTRTLRTPGPHRILSVIKATADTVSTVAIDASYHSRRKSRWKEASGGTVLERFDQSQVQTDGDTVLMVCNRPCRTERYIRSLAANIRAVSHDWV